MSDEQTQPVITEHELDLSTVVRRRDRHLRVPVAWRKLIVDDEGQRGGEVIAMTTERYPIPERLPIPVMTRFLRLEERINACLQIDGETEEDATDEEVAAARAMLEQADRDLQRHTQEAHNEIQDLIVRRTTDAFEPREHGDAGMVVGAIELEDDQVLVMLAWIGGGPTVADAVAQALTAGRSLAKNEDELGGDDPAGSETPGGGSGGGGGGAPLASKAP